MEIFQLSDTIAFLSCLVAILSAIYARWGYSETKKANKIAIHNKKLELYKSFNLLHFTISKKGVSISYADIMQFSEPSRHSEFYFSQKTSGKIKQYFDISFEISDLSRKISRKNIKEEKLEIYYSKQDLLFKKEFEIFQKLDKELKKDIKVM